MKMHVAGVALVLLLLALASRAQELNVCVDHPDAQYRAGQTATFTVVLAGAGDGVEGR